MEKNREGNKKKYLIIGIILLCIVILLSTYALYTFVVFGDLTVDSNTNNLDYYINYAKGTDITSGTLNPTTNYLEGNSVSIELWKKNDDYTIYGHIYMDINSIGDNLKKSNALKYTVVNNSTIIASGSIGGYESGTSILLKENINLETSQQFYTVYLWLDENAINNYDIENENISATIRCEATMKEINPASKYIRNLYTPNTTAVNNSITYNLDSTNNLMEDVAGNIRYYGKSPNNYIYFNCETYPETNCELWRIIGVFGDKIKIIRNESIGGFAWDNKSSGTGSSTSSNGSNDWTDARLMMLLNPGYETTSSVYSYEGSLYWNSKSGTCYSGKNNATTSCNFTSTGLKNDTTRKMIAEVTWNLGGWNTADGVYSNQIYSYERGTTVYLGRPTSWTGKIALMYLSDYGYATDFTRCTKDLYNYHSSDDSYACRTNNWLFNSSGQWLLTPNSSNANNAWYVNSSGDVRYSNIVYSAVRVRPVLYLNSDTGIVSESGTEADPYRIS